MQSKPVVYTRDAVEEKETTDIDRNQLIQYLTKRMTGQNWNNCTIHRCTSGYSNPPYVLDCGSNKYILRTKHDIWGILERHSNCILDIKQQYELISLLNKFTNVPVPKMYLFCDDETIIGKTFYIMEFIDARIFTHIAPDLPTIPKHDRIKLYTELMRVLALIHSVDIHKTGIWNVIKNQLKVYVDSVFNEVTDDYPPTDDKNITQNVIHFKRLFDDKVMEYKRTNKRPEFTTLIHGDYHWENILWHPTEYKIIAVVDWEGCSSGNPFLDLAYVCGIYVGYETESMAKMEPKFEYFPGFKHINVKQLGIPTMNEQIGSYMNVVKKTCSAKTINEMTMWLTKSNWSVAMALNSYKIIAGFYQVINDQEENRLSETFKDRQYALFDAMAEVALDMFNQERVDSTLLKSKL